MLLRRAGIRGLPGRKQRRPVHETPTAVDLVDRKFGRDAPNQLWVTDITEHPTREGKVYCAVVLDVHSRRLVGWSIDSSQTAALATNALGMAISNRSSRPTGTVIHSDHGVQGNSRPGPSPAAPGSPGSCRQWDRSGTAMTTPSSSRSGGGCRPSSSTGAAWKTRIELANALSEYLEMFHNRRRRHTEPLPT